MLSNLLGLTIDKGDLNKSSPSPVVSTLKKTAINYLAIGKMAEDLKLIKLNFSRYLAMEGVKVRGTPDAHFLKDDERTKKFNVLREKYAQSKISAGAKDGTSGNKGWTKILIAGLIGYKFRKKIQRNLTAVILKQYRKQTTIRQLARLKRKVMSKLNALLGKLNLKKMFLEWFKNNSQKIIKPLTEMFTNALKRFLKKGLTKAIARVGIAVASSIWSGPFVPIVAAVIFMGLTLWDPVKEAWRAYTEGEDWVQNFIVNVIDELTFGIFGKENIKNFTDSIAGWFTTLGKKLTEAIDEATKYIKEKVTSFADFLIEKGKSMLVPNDKPENFTSALEELNAKRAQEHKEMLEKYGKYFDEMGEKIEKAKITIAQLKVEIAVLESEIKYLTEGPEKARLEEAKIEKAKEELKLTELAKEQKKEIQVGDFVKEERKPATVPASAKVSTPSPPSPPKPIAVTAPPSSKPTVVAEMPAIKTAATTAKNESVLLPSEKVAMAINKAAQLVGVDTSLMYAIAKQESAFNPEAKAKGTTATGLFQFIKGTWEGMVKTYGNKFPILKEKGPLDPEANAIAGALYIKENASILSKAKIPIDATSIYAAHFLGSSGAKKLFSMNQTEIAAKKMSDAADKNKSVFYKTDEKGNPILREPKTAGEVIEFLFKKVGQYQGVYAAILPKSGSVGSTQLASAGSVDGKIMEQNSKEVAQAQREQLKPKDVNVADASKTNNVKKTNYQNVAMGDKPDLGTQMANRAA